MELSVQATITILEHMEMVTYFVVASMVVLVYDYALTFGLEVSLVWSSRWNLTKVLFLLTRYMPFVDLPIILSHQLKSGMNNYDCELAFRSSGWIGLGGTAVAEIILTIRTWAVWGRDKRLTISLPIFFVVCWAPDLTAMGLFLESMKFDPAPILGFRGCFITGGSSILFACWVLLTVYEAGILALMAIRGIAAYRAAGDFGLFNVVYRDGIVYYLYVAVLSALNVVVIFTLPDDLANLLAPFARVIHSTLTSRVILQIREQASKDPVYPDGLTDAGIYGRSVSLQTMSFLVARNEKEDTDAGQTTSPDETVDRSSWEV